MPPSRPVAQKSQASAQPDLRAETDGVLGGRQRLQRRRLARPAPLLQRAARLRIGQRDAHGLDLAAVGKLKEILQETVLGPAPFEDFQLGPLAGRVQRRPGGVGQAAHRSGRKPHRAVAVEAGEDPGRDVGADAEARDGRRQRGAIQVAQVQRFGGVPIARRRATVAHCPDAPSPRPPARRLAPDPPRRRRPRRHAGNREGRRRSSGSRSSDASCPSSRTSSPTRARRRCWSCCRDATPAARTGRSARSSSSATSSRATCTRSRCRPRRSARTTSCGGPTRRSRGAAT